MWKHFFQCQGQYAQNWNFVPSHSCYTILYYSIWVNCTLLQKKFLNYFEWHLCTTPYSIGKTATNCGWSCACVEFVVRWRWEKEVRCATGSQWHIRHRVQLIPCREGVSDIGTGGIGTEYQHLYQSSWWRWRGEERCATGSLLETTNTSTPT